MDNNNNYSIIDPLILVESREKKQQIIDEMDSAYEKLNIYITKMRESGRKESTLKTYCYVIDVMIKFFVSSGLHCDPVNITKSEIITFIRSYNKISDLTKKSYIQIFSKWIMAADDNDVVRKMDILWPKSSRPGRKWARYDVAVKVFRKEKSMLNKMILALAMDQGMRAIEIASLKLSDFDGEMIRIHGKGHINGKVRYLPKSRRVKKILSDYLEWREAHMKGKDHSLMIVNKRGEPLTPHAVTLRVINLGKKYNVTLTAHALRRRFITDTLDSGVKIEVCAKMVGHESPSVTALYYNCEEQKISEAMEMREKYVLKSNPEDNETVA